MFIDFLYKSCDHALYEFDPIFYDIFDARRGEEEDFTEIVLFEPKRRYIVFLRDDQADITCVGQYKSNRSAEKSIQKKEDKLRKQNDYGYIFAIVDLNEMAPRFLRCNKRNSRIKTSRRYRVPFYAGKITSRIEFKSQK